MITHKIITTPTPTNVIQMPSHVPGMRRQMLPNGVWEHQKGVGNQEELDSYIERMPAHIKEGNFVTFFGCDPENLKGLNQVHYIVEVEKDFNKLPGHARLDRPRLVRMINLLFTRTPDDKITSAWDRKEDARDWRLLSEEELNRLVRNDYVQDCIQRWKRQHGFSEETADNAGQAGVQGDRVSSGTGEV